MDDVSESTGTLPSSELPLLDHTSRPASAPLCSGTLQAKAVRFGSLDSAHLTLVKRTCLPLVTVLVLINCTLIHGQSISLQLLALALVSFLISAQVFTPLDLSSQQSIG